MDRKQTSVCEACRCRVGKDLHYRARKIYYGRSEKFEVSMQGRECIGKARRRRGILQYGSGQRNWREPHQALFACIDDRLLASHVSGSMRKCLKFPHKSLRPRCCLILPCEDSEFIQCEYREITVNCSRSVASLVGWSNVGVV